MELGVQTETLDKDGAELESKPWDHVTVEAVKKSIESFDGGYLQSPPLYSAKKYKGKPLYYYARKGIELDIDLAQFAREVKLSDIKIHSIELPFVSLEVTCSAGTYVRCLARDIALKLDTVATVNELERTVCLGIKAEEALSSKALRDMNPEGIYGFLTPMADLKISGINQLLVRSDLQVQSLRWGKSVVFSNHEFEHSLQTCSTEEDTANNKDIFLLFDRDQKAFGLGKIKAGEAALQLNMIRGF
jgi:tRNA pseudouridine55 synthase